MGTPLRFWEYHSKLLKFAAEGLCLEYLGWITLAILSRASSRASEAINL